MKFASLLVSGISLGCIYGLVALGIVILFKATKVLSFAHGALVVLGAYLVARTHHAIGWPAAVALAIVGTCAVALVVERAFARPLRDAPVVALAIMTIGLNILLTTDMTRRIGTDVLDVGQPWGGGATTFGSLSVPTNRLVAMVVAAVLIAAFFAALRFTSWGLAMRAAAEDREASELVGIRLGRISMSAWILSGALAAVAGIFLTGAPTPGLTPVVGSVALRAFPAVIVGGLDSPVGALVGGLIIGLAETFASGYQNDMPFLGQGLGDVVPYVVMIAFLLVRPTGLFGTKELARA